jgi:hypothetical protein
LKGQWSDKVLGAPGHDDMNVGSLLGQFPQQQDRFVGGNAPADSQKYFFTLQHVLFSFDYVKGFAGLPAAGPRSNEGTGQYLWRSSFQILFYIFDLKNCTWPEIAFPVKYFIVSCFHPDMDTLDGQSTVSLSAGFPTFLLNVDR